MGTWVETAFLIEDFLIALCMVGLALAGIFVLIQLGRGRLF